MPIFSDPETSLTEFRSKYIKYPITPRRHLIRRPSNLKLEGEFHTTTEQTEKFIEYLLQKRPKLIRKPTNLTLEGEMNIRTENREKFVDLGRQSRPPLCKKFTNLHLEGDLILTTEKIDQFVRYDAQRRPPLIKKPTNLHIEGEIDLLPEYRKEFIEYKTERPKLALPVNNLKTDGFYEADNSQTLYQQQIHPEIPFLRGRDVGNVGGFSPRRRTRENSLQSEGFMDTQSEGRAQFVEKSVLKNENRPKISNNLQLEGRIDLNPEYRNAYTDFSKKNQTPITRRIIQPNNLRSEGKMEINPEYSCSYVDFPRERPRVRRPQCSISSEGEVKVKLLKELF